MSLLLILGGSYISKDDLNSGTYLCLAGVVLPVFTILILAVVIEPKRMAARQEAERQKAIEREASIRQIAEEQGWTQEQRENVILRQIQPDMTENMVLLAWGPPTTRDNQEITKSGLNKERWVYGIPRQGASYVSFTDGKVARIKLP